MSSPSILCFLPIITSLGDSNSSFLSFIFSRWHIHITEQSSKMVAIIQQVMYKFASVTTNSTQSFKDKDKDQVNFIISKREIIMRS